MQEVNNGIAECHYENHFHGFIHIFIHQQMLVPQHNDTEK